jgi:hypothetical protein
VRHFHFYTLNRAALTASICHLFGKKRAAMAPRLAEQIMAYPTSEFSKAVAATGM